MFLVPERNEDSEDDLDEPEEEEAGYLEDDYRKKMGQEGHSSPRKPHKRHRREKGPHGTPQSTRGEHGGRTLAPATLPSTLVVQVQPGQGEC